MILLETTELRSTLTFIKIWMLKRGLLVPDEIPTIGEPAIILVPTKEYLKDIFYHDQRKQAGYDMENEIEKLAFYSAGTVTYLGIGEVERAVFLPKCFDKNNLEDVAILVHEFVHYIQDIRGRWPYIFGTIMEAEANIIEEMFRRDYNLGSISEIVAQYGYRFGS